MRKLTWLAACIIILGCAAKGPVPEIILAEGSNLPAVSALAWLNVEDSPGAWRFASLSYDGFMRVWEIPGGRLLEVYSAGAKMFSDGKLFEERLSFVFVENEKPLYSPDGTKKLLVHDDGGIRLFDSANGTLLARFYGFDCGEWISLVPDGFFNASFQGASFLVVEVGDNRFPLDKFHRALFRPDLFKAQLLAEQSSVGGRENRETLKTITSNNSAPPLVSLSLDDEQRLKINITGQRGGLGLVALYLRCSVTMEEIPAGLFGAEPEIVLRTGAGEFGVSAFNKANTVESERVWIQIPCSAAPLEAPPVLKALIAVGDSWYQEPAAALGELLSLQAGLELYSAVEVKTLFGEEFNKAAFTRASSELFSDTGKNHIQILYIQGRGKADSFGNLLIDDGPSAEDILKPLLNTSLNSIILMDLLPYAEGCAVEAGIALDTALQRFRRKLGPRAMLVTFGASGSRDSVIDTVMERLNPDFLTSGVFGNRYVDTAELFAHTKGALAGEESLFMAFPPREDFRITSRLANAGELRFQTMTSGMLRIDRVDSSPNPLNFGQTKNRFLPPGSYIVEMFYRNGHRETRFVELRRNSSTWVVFNYTPPRFVGDFSQLRSLPGAIHIGELNPVNYQRFNREAMEAMGVPPYLVAFLSGENYFRAGNYARAIADYNRSISLRGNNVNAFISRGNAHRRRGDFDRAIEDYSRAISLGTRYAEVFNFRGFLYAARGDLQRAIADYTQAIRLRPNYTDALFNRAFAHALLGNWDLSIADYSHVIRLEPSNAIAHHQRGLARQNRGDRALATADFDAAERLSRR